MAPKRRGAAELAAEPEPKRRVTRSTTKSDSSAAQDSTVAALNASRETSNPKGKPRAKDTNQTKATTSNPKSAKSKAKGSSAESNQPSTTTSSNTATLAITNPLLKNPIQCTTYAPPTPSSPSPRTLIFTHGAGGTLSAPAVVHFCTGFSTALPIHAFQGSMNLASRVKGFHACIAHLRSSTEKRSKAAAKAAVLGGRSMGARAAVIAASEILAGEEEGTSVQLVLVSYPLKGPKDDVRDQILLDLPVLVSVLFIIGERDAMCPLDLLESVRGKMEATSQLVVVRGADHGMHVKPAGREREIGEETGRLAAEWMEGMEMEGGVMYIGGEEEE